MPIAAVRPDLLYAWKGPALLIVNTRGECAGDRLCGFYYGEARFLETLRLEINGRAPWRCEAAALAPDVLSFNYVHPEVAEPGGGGSGQAGDEVATDHRGIPERAIDLQLRYVTRLNRLEVALTVTNRALRPVTLELAWLAATDFADIQETQGPRQQQASVSHRVSDRALEFSYDHASLPYRTTILCPDGWTAAGDRIRTAITLQPQERADWTLHVVPSGVHPRMNDADAVNGSRPGSGGARTSRASKCPATASWKRR